MVAGGLGANLAGVGLAILALVTLAPPVPAQAADAPYDPFDRCAFYAGDPDYPEVSARNPKPVARYLGDLSRVYGRPFDFIEVAPAIEHCEAAVAHPDAQPRHGYFLARAYLRHGAVDKAFPLLIETARQGEPGQRRPDAGQCEQPAYENRSRRAVPAGGENDRPRRDRAAMAISSTARCVRPGDGREIIACG